MRVYQLCALVLAIFLLGSLQAATLLQYKEAQGAQYQVHLGQNQVGSQDGFYNLKSDLFVVVDHRNKSYSQISRDELTSMVNMSKQVMTQLEGMSAYLPPEYRDALGSAARPTQQAQKVESFKLKKLGESKVAGYSCTRYQLLEASQMKGEVCLASPSQLSLPQEDIASLVKAAQVTKELLSQIPGITAQQLQQVALFQDGIPLLMKNTQGESWTLEAVKSSQEGLSIPAGYKEKPLALPQF
jgi:hypothetical protein